MLTGRVILVLWVLICCVGQGGGLVIPEPETWSNQKILEHNIENGSGGKAMNERRDSKVQESKSANQTSARDSCLACEIRMVCEGRCWWSWTNVWTCCLYPNCLKNDLFKRMCKINGHID